MKHDRSAGSSRRNLFLPNVVAAATYDRDTLGFSFDRLWGGPPSFCMVQRGGIVIMLAQVEARNTAAARAPD